MGIRVVQWATGNIGGACLRQVLSHPGLELAGVFVYSPEKEGQDAGQLAGLGMRYGVRATSDRERIFALDADVVLHTPLNARGNIAGHDRDVLRLLRGGKNVISTASYIWPRAHGEEYANQFADAARAGRATLLGSGLNPGFIFERLGPLCTAVCADVESIRFAEVFDVGKDPSPAKLFGQLGMGLPEQEYRQRAEIRETFDAYFSEVIYAAADALGLRLAGINIDLDLALAPHDLKLRAGNVRAGTVAGTRWVLTGQTREGPTVSLAETWAVDRDIPGWDVRNHWKIEIEGTPSFRAEFGIGRTWADPGSRPRYDPFSAAIAAVAVNAIPDVCAAPAGIAHPALCGSGWRARQALRATSAAGDPGSLTAWRSLE